MYRNHDSVGCLQVTASRIGNGLELACQRIGEDIDMSLTRIGGDLSLSLERVGGDLIVDTLRLNKSLLVTCSVVCSTGMDEGYYFLVREGLFILSDGKKFALKDELSK